MGMGGHLGFVEGVGLRLKLEGSWSLALTLFYLGVGGIQILALILQGLHPPHLGVLALLSLTAAYGIMRRRWWVVHLVVALFLLGTTFGAATLYSSIRLQTFYPDLPGLIRAMAELFDPLKVNVALSSLRVDDQLQALPALLRSVRKSGLTIAPEAARDELRRRINKNISTADLLRGAREAYRQGWRAVKLYFMIGLPGETDEDVDAIADLAHEVSAQRGGRGGQVNVAVASFVPKPHTPFQWEAMDEVEVLREKQRRILARTRSRRVRFKFHNVERSHIEAVLSRGDRLVAEAVARAHALGAQLDAWDEHFSYDRWLRAFAEVGVDPRHYANRTRADDEPLPWDHIDSGVVKEFLVAERRRAERGETTPDCRLGICPRCGACGPRPKE